MNHILQFITHSEDTSGYGVELAQIKQALEGGCRWIQLRKKGASHETLCNAATEALGICKKYAPEAILIIDDDIRGAIECGASGVHLGKNDMPLEEARELAPEGFIIGATANTVEDIERAAALGADYIGLGPLRYTGTKKNLSPLIGHEGYVKIMNAVREKGITIPIVAIGSVRTEDIIPLMQAGLSGIAVSGAIISSPNPVKATSEFINILDSTY